MRSSDRVSCEGTDERTWKKPREETVIKLGSSSGRKIWSQNAMPGPAQHTTWIRKRCPNETGPPRRRTFFLRLIAPGERCYVLFRCKTIEKRSHNEEHLCLGGQASGGARLDCLVNGGENVQGGATLDSSPQKKKENRRLQSAKLCQTQPRQVLFAVTGRPP